MSVLPKELNYQEKLHALPSSTHTISCVISPNNGTTFYPQEIISWDLPSRGYLVPNSMYVRYRQTIVKATEATEMLGVPATTPFSRLETIIGGAVVESIQDYNQVCNMVINTKLNYAQKVGLSNALGFLDAGTTTPAFNNMDGCKIAVAAANAAAGIYDRAFPLGGLLANCENLFPLGLAPAVRIQLTTEALATMFLTPTTAVTSSVLSRVELCFDIVEFGQEVDAIVKSMADANGNLIVKSQTYNTSTLNVPAASSGSIELTYNQRISSIKSIFAIFSSTTKGAKKFSAKDITSNLGDFQFFVGSEAYPPRPISATSKPACLMELAQAFSNAGSIDMTNMSITRKQHSFIDNVDDTGLELSKFYIGTNTERLSSNSAILTGISSQLSPISLRVNFGGATTADTHNATLICLFDALININIITKQCSVKS